MSDVKQLDKQWLFPRIELAQLSGCHGSEKIWQINDEAVFSKVFSANTLPPCPTACEQLTAAAAARSWDFEKDYLVVGDGVGVDDLDVGHQAPLPPDSPTACEPLTAAAADSSITGGCFETSHRRLHTTIVNNSFRQSHNGETGKKVQHLFKFNFSLV